jgi:glucose/arabinose dehydrogenase
MKIAWFAVPLLAGAIAVAWQQPALKLPPAHETPSVKNGPKVIPRPDGAQLKVPAGFTVEEFASGFAKPRIMLQGPGGEVLVSDQVANGTVYALKGGEKTKLIEGLDRPYGLAFWKDYLYVSDAIALRRYKYNSKALSVGPASEVVNHKDFTKGHFTHSLTFDAKGEKLYYSIGSGSNSDPDDDPLRATIMRYNPDGTGGEMYAYGLRNVLAQKFYPGSNTLWVTVQERDGLGDDLVPDYFTHIQKGGFYGWPYAYFGPNPDPTNKGKKDELVPKAIVPDVALGAHMSSMDFIFYTGKSFPEKYRGGAFFAFRGSSNRSVRVGYSVEFIPFKNGKPSGAREAFLSGWMLGPDKREVWGRPVGLLQMADGSMLISDDAGNKIWRVAYKH